MKIVHWTLRNGSGMHRVAEATAEAERALGLDSVVASHTDIETWAAAEGAAVHVCHTHIPDGVLAKQPDAKTVYVQHGTIEHTYQVAFDRAMTGTYGHEDAWQLMQHRLQHSDAVVTFWPRHAALLDPMLDKGRRVDVVPMGVERDFWGDATVTSRGKFAGTPSVFTAENQHPIKWILDTILMWPLISAKARDAVLHAPYLPYSHHRLVFPLANRNGTSYKAHLSHVSFSREELRNAFRSTDFFWSPVRYGDFNRLCLEAKAAGATVVSYPGNPYADFWVPEGDHRETAAAFAAILSGAGERRVSEAAPDVSDTAKAMADIYGRIL